MDFTECYRAVASRDGRFDGQFVMAVRSTGIYCRPSCPARTPKPTHVQFYATSAAAHLAGYRACRRCLPEASPGSPEWNLRHDLAGRAMRLIGDGAVDREGVIGLAARLGYSPRQLNRVLVDELGAGPKALARAHRAQNARHLIVSTSMSMADTAFASGFASIRQFNDTVAEVFGVTPSQLRERARAVERSERAGAIRVRLAYRLPMDVHGIFRWFADRAVSGLEVVSLGSYTRTLRTSRGAAVVTISGDAHELMAWLWLQHLADLPEALSSVRRLFDLDADPQAIDEVLASDARLSSSLTVAPGIRLPGAVDATEILTRAIIGQQVSVASARGQLERLVAALAEPIPEAFAGHGPYRLFPTAEELATHAGDIVRGPRRRTETLVRVCRALAEGTLNLDIGTDKGELIRLLQQFQGIGPWTSDYVAMRYLGDPNTFVRRDVAIRRGARRIGFADDERRLSEATDAFAPWRSYACMHFWRAAVEATTEHIRQQKEHKR